jgi:hypothetical protein
MALQSPLATCPESHATSDPTNMRFLPKKLRSDETMQLAHRFDSESLEHKQVDPVSMFG